MSMAAFIENRLRLAHPSTLVALSLHFFCAYSAHCLCGGDTWGPPQALYCCAFSSALLEKASPQRLEQLWFVPNLSRKTKRPTFGFLMTAPNLLKTAPGSVKLGYGSHTRLSTFSLGGFCPAIYHLLPFKQKQGRASHVLRLCPVDNGVCRGFICVRWRW